MTGGVLQTILYRTTSTKKNTLIHSYNVTIKTIPARYAAEVHTTITVYLCIKNCAEQDMTV